VLQDRKAVKAHKGQLEHRGRKELEHKDRKDHRVMLVQLEIQAHRGRKVLKAN
jgi:hypothetical protein